MRVRPQWKRRRAPRATAVETSPGRARAPGGGRRLLAVRVRLAQWKRHPAVRVHPEWKSRLAARATAVEASSGRARAPGGGRAPASGAVEVLSGRPRAPRVEAPIRRACTPGGEVAPSGGARVLGAPAWAPYDRSTKQ